MSQWRISIICCPVSKVVQFKGFYTVCRKPTSISEIRNVAIFYSMYGIWFFLSSQNTFKLIQTYLNTYVQRARATDNPKILDSKSVPIPLCWLWANPNFSELKNFCVSRYTSITFKGEHYKYEPTAIAVCRYKNHDSRGWDYKILVFVFRFSNTVHCFKLHHLSLFRGKKGLMPNMNTEFGLTGPENSAK